MKCSTDEFTLRSLSDKSPECNFKACSFATVTGAENGAGPRTETGTGIGIGEARPGLTFPNLAQPYSIFFFFFVKKPSCIFIVPLVDKYRAVLTDGPASGSCTD